MVPLPQRARARVLAALLVVACAACGTSAQKAASPRSDEVGAPGAAGGRAPAAEGTVAPADPTEELAEPPPTVTPPDVTEGEGGGAPSPGIGVPRPDWLGTRVLTPGPSGYPPPQETPPELRDRRLATIDLLPPPGDDGFVATIGAVPDEVVERSTWSALCPVGLEDLRYVTVSFWGFDDRPYTGELLVNAAAAEQVVGVFARLHEARFPIEEMRITRADELDAPPTGDGNNTGSFVCRPARGSTSWSEHARGLAVDINPFHNPLSREGVVLPELATAYVDRGLDRPGMIQPGDVVTEAFAAIGWQWGGAWRSLSDWMHFSHNGR